MFFYRYFEFFFYLCHTKLQPMDLRTLIIIVITAIVVAAFLFGREAYKRHMRVRQKLQMGKIFRDITHELLTPLSVISASVDHLRDESPHYEHDYDLMQLNIQRMVRLLQQILETTKSQAGELKLKVSHGDVMQYIHNTACCLEPLIKKKNLSFIIECTPKSMMGWIDTDKLDKIIYNLLSNAAKYTDEGSVSLDVHTSKNFDYIYIKVSDTGSGISKQEMKHLFQVFYDGDYRRHRTFGTGIGLALTRDLVILHGGKITCESEEGKGTVLTVKLPITKEAFRPDQIDETHIIDLNIPQNTIIDFNPATIDINEEAYSDEQNNKEAYKILIVEDNPELLTLMRHVLRNQYRVFIAHNGKDALNIISHNDIDLIVSDIMMPEMNGLELTQALKGDDHYKHLPIILLTANTQEEAEQEALRIGADDFLKKPFRIGDLKLRIDNIIENRKRAQQDFLQRDESPTQKNVPLTPEQEFLRKAYECIHTHLSDTEYDRDAFATDMGASQSSLYNKLRAITGMNVKTFIRDIRMKEAYRMAEQDPSQRVSDLAYKVGFQDPKYFSTCFKKQFGIQPKEFMESLQEKR